jgi:beta-lactamase class A
LKEPSSAYPKSQPYSLRSKPSPEGRYGNSRSRMAGRRRIYKRRLAILALAACLLLTVVLGTGWFVVSNLVNAFHLTPIANAQLATFPTREYKDTATFAPSTWGTWHPATVDTGPFVTMIQQDFGLESRPSLLYPNLLTSWSLLLLAREANHNFLDNALSATPRLLPILNATEDTQLRDKLQAMLAQYPSKRFISHLFFYNPQNNTYVNINGYTPAPAASVIKLPILLEYLTRLDRRELTPDRPIFYADLYRASGAGELQYRPSGVEMPVNDIASQMIRISDNTCTNLMIGALNGTDAVNRQLEYLGLRQTRLRNWLPDLEGTNTISPYEMVTILHNLDSENLVSAPVQQNGLDILKSTHNRRLIVAPLPKDAVVAHKTGDIGTALGDSGIIYMPDGRKFYLSMQVERPFNDYTARDMVQKASRISYDYVAQSPMTPSLDQDLDDPSLVPTTAAPEHMSQLHP